MGSILKIDNLRYKNILKEINFSLEEKTFNILCGPNSSGKTTLVNCIAGFLNYEGNILFLGNILDNKNRNNLVKEMGILTDDNILFSGTVLYNLIYPLINLRYSEIEAKKKAYEISKKLNLDNLLLKNIDELSISEKKIVSFISILVHEPKFIIVDDSFDELDNYNRKKIINYLKNQNKSTILFITNNEEDILLADNVIIINEGKILDFKKAIESVKEEKLFTKNNVKLPFLVELSHKLKTYELIDDVMLNEKEMIEEIWN